MTNMSEHNNYWQTVSQEKTNLKENRLKRIFDEIFECSYDLGWKHGEKHAKLDYGESKGVAHVTKATKKDIKECGTELFGWCDCGKPIEGRWVGMANFCPWCGKIIEWQNTDTDT